MTDRNTWQRIRGIELDPENLAETGETLAQLLKIWNVAFDETLPPGAPASGWRLLREDGDVATIGAPQPHDRFLWWLGNVWRPTSGDAGTSEIHFHDAPLPLERSRADASRGLELRWPAVVRGRPDADHLAIDLVNIGSEIWWPARESFFVAGRLAPFEAESDDSVVFFGYLSGNSPAVALGPADYCRLPVTIPNWTHIAAGTHRLHATMPELGISVSEPLLVEISAEQIERRRRRTPRGH